MKNVNLNTIIHLAAALFAPPFGVYLHAGITQDNYHFWLNLTLTIVYHPLGLLHAIWVITQTEPRPWSITKEVSQ